MDSDALQDEVDEWIREGIISEQQAEEILARYDGDDSRQSRVVVALSLVGAALVFVGITLFLATNWSNFPRAVRAAVLVAGPGLAYAGGIAAYRRDAPQIGLALCILGAMLVGPSLFLFDDLMTTDIETAWLLFVWTAVALPTGHALESRGGVGLGLFVLVMLVVALVEPANPSPVLGLLGVVIFVASHVNRGRVAWTYEVGGIAVALAALFALTTLEVRGSWLEFDEPRLLAVGAAGALVGIGWLIYTEKHEASYWAVGALVAHGLAVTAVVLAPGTLPGLAAFAVTHLAMLAVAIGTGALGYATRVKELIDLAAIAGLFQTLSFVSATVIDELSGSVALVVAGLVLLGAGVALERGRRSLLTRLDPQD